MIGPSDSSGVVPSSGSSAAGSLCSSSGMAVRLPGRRCRARRVMRRSRAIRPSLDSAIGPAWCPLDEMEGWWRDGRSYPLGDRPEQCRRWCPPPRRPVRPCQRSLAGYNIPADRATDGAFRSLFDRAEVQVRDLITEVSAKAGSSAASDTDEQRIGDLYASFLDEDTVERRGVQP